MSPLCSTHLAAIAVATSACLAGTLAGCTREPDPAPRPLLKTTPDRFDEDVRAMQRTETRRDAVAVETELPPASELAVGENSLVWTVNGPQLLRITEVNGKSESTLMEVPAVAGDILVVTRRAGIQLGDQILRRRALDDRLRYRLYVLPPGGVRNEATQSTIRAATPAEREAALQELEARREAATQPSTQPSGLPPASPPANSPG